MSKSHHDSQKKQNGSENQQISKFEGYFSYLSNDFPTWVHLQGINFPSVSTAFQAARTDDEKLRQKIANVADVQQFRKIVMSIKNPPDWSQRKQKIMKNLVRDKFKRNKEIQEKLVFTKDKKIINGMKNGGYNQEYWGVYEGKGQNILGKILMSIRQELIKGTDTKNWIQNNLNLQIDSHMRPVVNLTVTKDGKKVDNLSLDKNKNYFLFGSTKTLDFYLQNPTISRNHSCIYFSQLQVMIIDLKSTHGTFIRRKGQNQKMQLEPLIGYRLYSGDIIQFGTSAREYVVNINRSQIEKYIQQQEQNLKEGIKNIQRKIGNSQEFQKLSKSQVKDMLGLENQCLLVEGIPETDSYQKLREVFSKVEKVKNIRIKINSRTGKSEGLAVVYFESKLSNQTIIKIKKQLAYKIKQISQKQAQQILAKKPSQKQKQSHRKRSKSRSRSRSRDKKQQKSTKR